MMFKVGLLSLLLVSLASICSSTSPTPNNNNPNPTPQTQPHEIPTNSGTTTPRSKTKIFSRPPVVYTADSVRQEASVRPPSPPSQSHKSSPPIIELPNHQNHDDHHHRGRPGSRNHRHHPNSPAQDEYPYLAQPDDPEIVNNGFVEPLDFDKFLEQVEGKHLEKVSKGFNYSPLTSESKSQGNQPQFFRQPSNQNIYYEPNFGPLSSASSNQNARTEQDDDDGQEDEDGFVDPNVQFRSLFDSSEGADGFRPQDFLDYKEDNLGADPSKGSQTQAYPSFTYTGRQGEDEDDYNDGIPPDDGQRFRSSFRQDGPSRGQQDGGGGDDLSRDPYHDAGYYGGEGDDSPPSPSPPVRPRGRPSPSVGRRGDHGPQTQESQSAPPQASSNSKGKGSDSSGKSRCKKVKKLVDHDEEEDYSSYSEPASDYDPSTYESRYRRDTKQASSGGRKSKNKRPMTCFICEDEKGHYAESCSYDSKAVPGQGSYFHSSSSSFNDNGKRGGRDRHRRNPTTEATGFHIPGQHQQGTHQLTASSDPASVPKHIEKRQSQGHRYAARFQDPNQPHFLDNPVDFGDYDLSGPTFTSRSSPYGPSSPINYGSSNRRQGRIEDPGLDQGFHFGPPADFGRDSSGPDSQGFVHDFSLPRDFDPNAQLGTSNSPIFSGGNNNEFGPEFNSGYDDYVKRYFPEAYGTTSSTPSSSQGPSEQSRGPLLSSSYQGPIGPSSSENYGSPPPGPYYGGGGGGGSGPSGPDSSGPVHAPEHLQDVVNTFDLKDRKDCQKVRKGGMTCYVCRDPRGMRKEECMYASNDPKNHRMAYHEVSEYSSLPPASVLPHPNSQHQPQTSQQQSSEESKRQEVIKSPLDYDFDY